MYLFFLPLFSHTPWFEQNYADVFTAVTLKTEKYLGFKLSGKKIYHTIQMHATNGSKSQWKFPRMIRLEMQVTDG